MKVNIAVMALLIGQWVATSPVMAEESGYSGFSTKGNLSVWRIHHTDGSVSLCSFEGHNSQPACYPWSDPAKGKVFSIIPGDDVLSAWRINSETGSVSLCEYKEVTERPVCTPWSED